MAHDFALLTRASVGHAQQEWLLVLQLKVLVLKLFAIDALSSSAIASSKVTTLDHERLDDSVESRSFVVKWLARFALALLASAKRSEIVCSLRYNIIVL